MMRSSSSVQSCLSTTGLKWLCHRSRHCLPVRSSPILRARSAQRPTPSAATSTFSASSSLAAHDLRDWIGFLAWPSMFPVGSSFGRSLVCARSPAGSSFGSSMYVIPGITSGQAVCVCAVKTSHAISGYMEGVITRSGTQKAGIERERRQSRGVRGQGHLGHTNLGRCTSTAAQQPAHTHARGHAPSYPVHLGPGPWI